MKNEQDGGQHDNNSNEKNDGGAMGSASEIWGKVKGKMREYLSDDAFTRWFKNAELVVDDERGPAVIGVKSDMQQIWIETNYLDEV
ncbi:hypothetical protein OAG79_03475, partial [Akkermansiaceae bacterium]|nr:hypothetical protein [Akkermansiaceae bacterium]